MKEKFGFNDDKNMLELFNDINIPLGMRMEKGCYEIASNSDYLVCSRELYLETSKNSVIVYVKSRA